MDEQALDEMRRELARAGWPFEELLDHAAATPDWWAALSPQEMARRLRWVRRMRQREVARLAGLGQSHVARIEKGADCRISTLWHIFRALGYKPILVAAYDRPEPRDDPRLRPSPLEVLARLRAQEKERLAERAGRSAINADG